MLNISKLYELMSDKGIKSLNSLSKLTKIPYTTLNYMLSGHDMYVSTLIELSKFFNVPLDYLIDKSYGVMTYSENGNRFLNTSSLIEATVL